MAEHDCEFIEGLAVIAAKKQKLPKAYKEYNYFERAVRKNHIKVGFLHAGNYAAVPHLFDSYVMKMWDLEDFKEIKDQLDLISLRSPLHIMIGVLGGYLLMCERWNWNKLHTNEAGQRHLDMIQSSVNFYI